MAFNMDPKKCPMPTQDPNVRNKNFKEVALGYTEEMAINEAKRVLAYEVTKLIHGEGEAIKARDAAEALFGGGALGGSVPTTSLTRLGRLAVKMKWIDDPTADGAQGAPLPTAEELLEKCGRAFSWSWRARICAPWPEYCTSCTTAPW